MAVDDRIPWHTMDGRTQVSRRGTVTIPAGTGLCIGPAPLASYDTWQVIDYGGVLQDTILYSDPATDVRYSGDSTEAARTGDRRSTVLESDPLDLAPKTEYVLGNLGTLAIWNPSLTTAAVVSFETRVCSAPNPRYVYPYRQNQSDCRASSDEWLASSETVLASDTVLDAAVYSGTRYLASGTWLASSSSVLASS